MSEIHFGFGVPLGEEGVPTPVSDGDPVDAWFDLFGRMVLYGANLAQGTIDVSEVAPATTMIAEESFTQLTAPGSTVEVNVQEYHHGTFQYVVANIDDNVVVRAEGSLDGTEWFNLDGSETDITQTANGDYAIMWSDLKVKYVRFTWVSESGGTSATIDVDLMVGN